MLSVHIKQHGTAQHRTAPHLIARLSIQWIRSEYVLWGEIERELSSQLHISEFIQIDVIEMCIFIWIRDKKGTNAPQYLPWTYFFSFVFSFFSILLPLDVPKADLKSYIKLLICHVVRIRVNFMGFFSSHPFYTYLL